MAKTAFTMRIQAEGLTETLSAFRKLPKDATKALRDGTLEISQKLAAKARQAAMSDFAPQSKLVAPTVKAVKDRVPAIQAGGAKRVGRHRVPAYKVLFGSEFGANRYPQFHRSHQGQEGAWFFPIVEANQAQVMAQWRKAADDIIDEFTAGGA